MTPPSAPQNLIIFDTTLRDGELTPGVKFSLQEKVAIAELLSQIGVQVIEVGYPGFFEWDFETIRTLSSLIHNSTICGLAGSKPAEIEKLGLALKSAPQSRINVYTNVNLPKATPLQQLEQLELIRESITQAGNSCDHVQWSAFDGVRTSPDFLCRAVETAITAGANTITIADSLGTATPEQFLGLLTTLGERVPNLDQGILAVHCHEDQGYSLENSLVGLGAGVKQIECSLNGLGARKGNLDLLALVRELPNYPDYQINLNLSLLEQASELVAEITKLKKI